MEYTLAKELSEAGFTKENMAAAMMEMEGETYYPTLEELIEACGDSLTILENWGDGWSAYEERQDLIGKDAKGATPAEAVARLWLALNLKSV